MFLSPNDGKLSFRVAIDRTMTFSSALKHKHRHICTVKPSYPLLFTPHLTRSTWLHNLHLLPLLSHRTNASPAAECLCLSVAEARLFCVGGARRGSCRSLPSVEDGCDRTPGDTPTRRRRLALCGRSPSSPAASGTVGQRGTPPPPRHCLSVGAELRRGRLPPSSICRLCPTEPRRRSLKS